MNKEGFTLIELLAVIVILSIIALIATPIVLNIIKDSRESAGLRSAEMYLKGVETSIATATINNKKVADGTYSITKDGDICLVTLTDNKCDKDNTLEVEMNGDKPESGTVTILNGKVTDIFLTYTNGKTIVKNDGKLVYGEKETQVAEKTLDKICTYLNNGVTEKTAGAKYSCEVKEGTSYNFYILTTPKEGATTINLIMDRNICEDGTPTDASKEEKCLVAWNNESGQSTSEYGPITAMSYLYNATKDWINIDPINYIYNDREVQEITEVEDSDGSNEYLYENLDGSYWSGSGTKPTNNISGIYGYWSLSSSTGDSANAWIMLYFGDASGDYGGGGSDYIDSTSTGGVRPVITLKL